MDGFKQFTRIKGVSERRRLPRLGKIRLGIKCISKKTGGEFPKEVDYFVVPPEVAEAYGAQPRELDVMLPVNNPEVIFSQRLVWYGSSRGPKCIGNGETAMRVNESTGEFQGRDCPCDLFEQRKCQRRAHLLVMLPKISISGIYQIDVGSYNSIVDINSGLDYIQAMVGRFAMVPLILRRVPRETHGSGKKETHFTLQILANFDVNTLNLLRQDTTRVLTAEHYALPAPEDINPKMDEGGEVVEVDEEPETQGEVGLQGEKVERDPKVIESIAWLERKKVLDLEKVEKIVSKKRDLWGLEDLKEVRALYDKVMAGGESLDMILAAKMEAEVPELFKGAGEPPKSPDPSSEGPETGQKTPKGKGKKKETPKPGAEAPDGGKTLDELWGADPERKIDRLAGVTCPKDQEYRTGGWCQDSCIGFMDCEVWKGGNHGND